MGIYSTNRTYLTENYDAKVPVDESYFGITGALNAMIDIENNNHAIFESTIARDFRSADMFYQGYNEATLIAFNEASLDGFVQKIKQMVMKIWEKIKGIFSTFLKKLESVIVKDNKKYVEKYGKEVRLKDLSKLKYKIQKRQDGFDKVKALVSNSESWKIAASILYAEATNPEILKEMQDKITDGELTSYLIKELLGEGLKIKSFNNIELNELPKEIHGCCFADETEEEGLDDEIDDIIRVLKGDKTVSDIKKAQTSANKHFKKVIDSIKDFESYLDKQIGKGEKNQQLKGTRSVKANTKLNKGDDGVFRLGPDKDQEYYKPKHGKEVFGIIKDEDEDGKEYDYSDYEIDITGATYGDIPKLMKACGTAQKVINTVETIHSNTITCFLNENKFNITQSRKLFNKAVAYNPKKAKNEAMQIYLDAVEEAAEYEISSLFEDYSI